MSDSGVQTHLQRGRQYAQAVQTLVELRVGGPTQEGLPEFWLTSALGAAAERTDPALLARPEQVAKWCSLAAAFTHKHKRGNFTNTDGV